MESLQGEIEPFGIQTMIVNPGFFRTELLTDESTNYAAPAIKDYDERRRSAADENSGKSQNGKQTGRPGKARSGAHHHTPASQKVLPRRFIAGADAIGTAEQKIAFAAAAN